MHGIKSTAYLLQHSRCFTVLCMGIAILSPHFRSSNTGRYFRLHPPSLGIGLNRTPEIKILAPRLNLVVF